jgi:DnaJ-like protein
MFVLELLAERKIEEAIDRGELDDLPGAGGPLELDDDPLVPEELRAPYRILKNAGYVPPEVQTLNQIAELERYVARGDLDANAVARGLRKLALLKTRVETAYYRKVVNKLGR